MAMILLVDDDSEMLEYTSEYLQAKGLATHMCSRPNLVMPFLETNEVDLCVIDVNMPHLNGFELANEIKAKHPMVPFLFLSGQTSKDDRIKGLKLGADDYIVKPFSLEELYLRIQAILHRTQKTILPIKSDGIFYLGKIAFDSDYRQLNLIENTIKLSATENQILILLCLNKNELVSRNNIMTKVWGDNDEYKSRSLNVYITKLRKYLEADPHIEIVNEHGRGYRLVAK